MDQQGEFAQYVSALAQTLEHADRVGPLGDYCRALMLSGERKSVEPMAALVAPQRASAKHQSMHHFVAKAQWNDAAMLGRCALRCCRHWVPSRLGSWMTPATRRRASIRSG